MRKERISRLSLKYKTYFDDIADWKETYLEVDDLTTEMFDWLVTKSFGTFKYWEIDTIEKPKNLIMTTITFKRNLMNSLIAGLEIGPLFGNKLKNDCLKGIVFPAVRNGYIDFYHKGGRLFKFDNQGFQTHVKYAAVIEKDKKDYLTEQELKVYELANNFIQSYKRMKENCANYSGVEAFGVSQIYHRFPYLFKDENIVVLDIEVSFKSLGDNEKKTQDRIDILLFNLETRQLQFVEAKHYSNSEIWSRTIPKVIDQLSRYKKQIHTNKTSIIIEYANYVSSVNKLFRLNLPKPIEVKDEVVLLIFGFDKDQKTGRLKDLIEKNTKYNGINVYSIGNLKHLVPQNLWNVKPIFNET